MVGICLGTIIAVGAGFVAIHEWRRGRTERHGAALASPERKGQTVSLPRMNEVVKEAIKADRRSSAALAHKPLSRIPTVGEIERKRWWERTKPPPSPFDQAEADVTIRPPTLSPRQDPALPPKAGTTHTYRGNDIGRMIVDPDWPAKRSGMGELAERGFRLLERFPHESGLEEALGAWITECDWKVEGWYDLGAVIQMRTTDPAGAAPVTLSPDEQQLWRDVRRRIDWLRHKVA